MLAPEHVSAFGKEYVIGRLDLFESLNVCRIASPILPVIFSNLLASIVDYLKRQEEEEAAGKESDRVTEVAVLIATCEPVLKRIAEIPKKDFEYLVRTCLSCIERKSGKGYAKIMRDGELLFDDIDQATAVVLAIRVLIRELKPFINALKA